MRTTTITTITKSFGARAILCVLGVLCGSTVFAQFEMPDMKQMSGIPRPVTDLPDGAVSVRLIKGDLAHNLTNHPVELHIGSEVKTATTDENGRAEFTGLKPGATLKATAEVDGEHLESQEFPAPAQGGIRLMLVATDKSKGPATTPNAPPISGQVVLTNRSRILIRPADEALQMYYLLDISNTARAPVNPTTPFEFDLPSGAIGTTLLEGSTAQASVKGTHVRVAGPFPPGQTMVQIGCELPVTSGTLQITQRFPATLEELDIAVQKVGDMKLASPQVNFMQEMPAQGETYIAAGGNVIAAGQPIALTLTGLPHHSAAPRWTALSLAAAILLIGAWASKRPDDRGAREDERRRLIGRRDRLFNELVRLEHDHRTGKVAQPRYRAKREELVAALEHVYGALDTEDTSPEPADGAGVAA